MNDQINITAETDPARAALWIGQYILSDATLRRAYMVEGETDPVYIHRLASCSDDIDAQARYSEAKNFYQRARIVTAAMSAAQNMSAWESDVRARAIEQIASEIERVTADIAMDGSTDGDFDLSRCDALAEVVRQHQAA